MHLKNSKNAGTIRRIFSLVSHKDLKDVYSNSLVCYTTRANMVIRSNSLHLSALDLVSRTKVDEKNIVVKCEENESLNSQAHTKNRTAKSVRTVALGFRYYHSRGRLGTLILISSPPSQGTATSEAAGSQLYLPNFIRPIHIKMLSDENCRNL